MCVWFRVSGLGSRPLCINVCMHVYTYIRVCVCVCVCVFLGVCILRTHIHTHTYINMYTPGVEVFGIEPVFRSEVRM